MHISQFDSHCVFTFYIDNTHNGSTEYSMRIRDRVWYRVRTAHPSFQFESHQNNNLPEFCITIVKCRLLQNEFVKNFLLEGNRINRACAIKIQKFEFENCIEVLSKTGLYDVKQIQLKTNW